VAGLAKGAKRLKSAFDSALDLLSLVRVVFLPKSSGLSLFTEAQLVRRFQPVPNSLQHLYGGYYIAELLDAVTEPDDPHPKLFDDAVQVLDELGTVADPRIPILNFELSTLREIGHLPNLEYCDICHTPVAAGESGRYWVSQGGLICSECGRPEFEHTEIHPGTIAVMRKLTGGYDPASQRLSISPHQYKELRRLLTAMLAHVLGKRPKMLSFLQF
jgi:DNA repair protein RecO (recombination protein O)